MEWSEVQQRIKAGEDRFTEFKRELELRRIGRAICGFANTQGGVVILGVDDSGDIVGVRGDPKSVRERLASFLQNGRNVPVRANCDSRETPRGVVHWIEVPRQRGLEPMRHDGRVWVRRARTTVEPSPAQLQYLYNAFGFVFTEEQTISAAGPVDIDMVAFRSHLARQGFAVVREPQPAVEDDLRNRGAAAEFDGLLHPTLYGLLAFGKQPQSFPHTGNFWIDCVAYGGNDQAADVILAGTARGRLDEQVQQALGGARDLGRFEKYEGAHPSAAARRHPRGAGERGSASGLRHHRFQSALGGVLRPRRRHQPWHPAQSLDGRRGSHWRTHSVPQRADGQLHA